MYGCLINSKTACVVLNGEIGDYEEMKEFIESQEYGKIIAVDGGANHLYKIGVVPDYIVGDLDSIDDFVYEYYNEKGVEVLKYPSKKNETDTELAVIKAIEDGCVCVDILGALGGRIDHELANVFLLHYIMKKEVFGRIVSKKNEIYIVENDELVIEGCVGDIISILPLKGDANGVTLRNLEYTLEEFDMRYSVPRGISNVMTDTLCYIDVRDGCLVVIKNKFDK